MLRKSLSCLSFMRRIRLALAGFLTCCLLAACAQNGDDGADHAPVVLAASSLQEALGVIASAYADKGNKAPLLSFASSASLARQIEYGAPADLFISADQQWMDRVENLGHVQNGGRADLLTNRLVLIAPLTHQDQPDSANLAAMIGTERVAIGEAETVPAGRYAKALLTNLKLWEGLEGQMIGAENVRAALALVERGEADFGLVYASDAAASSRVKVIHEFAGDVQPEISYPLALLAAGTSAQAEGFFTFLTSDEAAQIFIAHGFGIAP